MMSNFVSRLKSRKFILAVVAALVAFLNAFFELGLTTEQVWSVLAPILTYIGVEGARDFREAGNQTITVEGDYLHDEVEGV